LITPSSVIAKYSERLFVPFAVNAYSGVFALPEVV